MASGVPIRAVPYRPFVKQCCYLDYALVQRKYQQDRIFPLPDTDNQAICVPATGSRRPFGALIVDAMPDLHFVEEACQCFPRYRFEPRDDRQPSFLHDPGGLVRADNIGDTALRAFRSHYRDGGIDKDAIFDYVYGILHAPAYRERFANDLAKGLPRVPFAPDFRAFASAGRDLAALHLGYESCAEHPLDVVFALVDDPKPEHYRLGRRAMRFDDEERSILVVNDTVRVVGIPPEAHGYQVNGRTPLEWLMDRYRVTTDRSSGIVNDPNEWFDDPRDLLATIRRIVHLSVETVHIVDGLPDPFGERNAE